MRTRPRRTGQALAGWPALPGIDPWLTLQLVALWGAWAWTARRMADPSDEPWGLAALALAAFLGSGRDDADHPPGWIPGILTLAYALSYPFLFPLLRAGLAVLAVGALLASRRGRVLDAPTTGLLLLALPVMPSLQFVLGYPLRALVAALTVPFLTGWGIAAARQGTCLAWRGQLVAIDPPCSGVKMLWAALVLAMGLAARRRLGPRRALALAAGATALVVAGNVLRSSSLFLVEVGIVPELPGAHGGIGLAAFLLVGAGVAGLAALLEEDAAPPPPASAPPGHAPRLLLAACGLALLAPLVPAPRRAPVEVRPVFWATEFEGVALERAPLGAREARFARAFPGEIARFRGAGLELVAREVRAPTRRLHPAEDCYRGLGFEVVPRPVHVDATGNPWTVFHARRGAELLEVREQVRAADGATFRDVSSWYWAALLGRTRGPWRATTVARPVGARR